MQELSNLKIIIATAGNHRLLKKTLQSLSVCISKVNNAEILVVENGAKCGTKKTVGLFKGDMNVTYQYCTEKGKNAALNYSINASVDESDFIVFTDDDVRFNPEWLIKYNKFAAKYGPGHYFGGAIIAEYEKEPCEQIKKHLPASARGANDEYFLHHPNKFLGANFGVFRKDIVETGLFDPRFGPGSTIGVGGEFNMQRRMYSRGIKPVFIPDNNVWHYVPEDKCTKKWLINRKIKKGLSKGMRLRKMPLKYYLEMATIFYNILLLPFGLYNKNIFYNNYFDLFYRYGLIKSFFILNERNFDEYNNSGS